MHIPLVSIKNMQNSQPGRSFSKLPDQVAKPPILALLNYGTFLVILVQLRLFHELAGAVDARALLLAQQDGAVGPPAQVAGAA